MTPTSTTTHHDYFVVDQFVGRSAWAQRIRRRVTQVAAYRYNVLISGEAGTGRELIARAIHAHSPRRAAPFIPLDCRTMTCGLFASQVAGIVRPSSSGDGSVTASLGCFRAADHGTIFLQDVQCLDRGSQELLNRILATSQVLPVGGSEPVAVDCRVMASTQVDLADLVREGDFRPDLFYRLNSLPIRAASLKSRREDIPALVRHGLAKHAVEHMQPLPSVSASAVQLLCRYDWPGNVTDLMEVLERALLLSTGEVLDEEIFASLLDLDADIEECSAPLEPSTEAGNDVSCAWPTLADVEARHVQHTLEQAGFNIPLAAELLGLSPDALQKKIGRS